MGEGGSVGECSFFAFEINLICLNQTKDDGRTDTHTLTVDNKLPTNGGLLRAYYATIESIWQALSLFSLAGSVGSVAQ